MDQVILDLALTDEEGASDTIGATHTHPFWVEGEGWVEAGDLAVGDSIASHDGDILTVTKRRAARERHATYNFEVADFHTYFVGEVGAWVHNNCPGNQPGGAEIDPWSRSPKSLQDQMALEAAQNGAGRRIISSLSDPMYSSPLQKPTFLEAFQAAIVTIFCVALSHTAVHRRRTE